MSKKKLLLIGLYIITVFGVALALYAYLGEKDATVGSLVGAISLIASFIIFRIQSSNTEDKFTNQFLIKYKKYLIIATTSIVFAIVFFLIFNLIVSKNRQIEVANKIGTEMIYIAGSDTIGGGIGSFYMGKYEITQEQWKKIMGSNPSYFSDCEQCPVERVSWEDVVGTLGKSKVINGINYYENGFIYKLNKIAKKQYRLPTAKEWEYAAREGENRSDFVYVGSDKLEDVAWFLDNSDNKTHKVGTKNPNALGLYDMSGNVSEWCQDCYGNCSQRMKRGGSWTDHEDLCRWIVNSTTVPNNRGDYIGFRLACSAE